MGTWDPFSTDVLLALCASAVSGVRNLHQKAPGRSPGLMHAAAGRQGC
jgi:hypothetical protein